MNGKYTVNVRWLKKAALYAGILGFLSLRCFAGLGLPPVIAVQPLGLSVQKGGTATITTTAVSLTSMTFTWQKDGKAITNPNVANVVTLAGTLSTLTIQHVGQNDQGAYNVVVQNGVGSVTSQSATLVLLGNVVSGTLNFVTGGVQKTATGIQLNLTKPAGSNCVIEASTDLTNWAPIATNSSASTNVTFTDTSATNLVRRYYRARLQ